jgi:Flp pilus assembly pilin Flp
MLGEWIAILRREDRAQDLIEYTLLIGFLAVAVIGLFLGSGGSVQGIWTTANSTIAAANSPATSGAPAPPPRGDGGGGDGGDSR